MVALTPSDIHGDYGPVFKWLNWFSSTLSVLGCLVVIVTFLLFPQLRRYFYRLVLYLAISDLWLCTSFLIGQSDGPHYTKCGVQSLLGVFFGLSSICWTVAIADSVRRVVLVRDLSVESKHEKRLHIICWGLPLAALVLVLSFRVTGPAGMICWISSSALGTGFRLLTFYLPLWVGIAYCLWVYWCVSRMLRKLLDQQAMQPADDYEAGSVWDYQRDLERQRQTLQLLMHLPLILIFCWAPSTLRRMLDVFNPELDVRWLDYLCVLAGPLQGALNAMIYGATPAVRDALTGRLDQSAKKLRGVQARLRNFRPKKRSGSRSFDQFNDETPGHLSTEGTTPQTANSIEPRPMQFGRSSEVSASDMSAGFETSPEIFGSPDRYEGNDRKPGKSSMLQKHLELEEANGVPLRGTSRGAPPPPSSWVDAAAKDVDDVEPAIAG
eukprot:TRINITY_DN13330_c5_g1_i1.p1 TRINITY_DN13330_c5_g1~~TRINITY_DN13330_c5_g1_i1.p1  ORF type:complete len:461 (+),score=51.67 TRINITY_DN13330_c5_g1_i1:71-1384(+)